MNVAVVSSWAEMSNWVLASLGDGTAMFDADPANPDAGTVGELVRSRPDVVVLDATADPDAVLATAAGLRFRLPATAVVVVGQLSGEQLTTALRAQVADVVAPADGPVALQSAVARVAGAAMDQPSQAQGHTEGPTTGRTVAVVAPKGGSGKTTVSCNLAVELARRGAGKVVLVDLDVQFGDVSSVLGVETEHDLGDAVAAVAAGSSPKMLLSRHPSGCYVLCGPASPLAADHITSEDTARLLEVLADEFDHVVVDTAAGLDEHTLAAVERADDLVVLASTDVASVRNARKGLDALDVVARADARRHVVINRADANVGIGLEDVEAALAVGVDVVVPQDRQVVVASNQGRPVVAHDPRASASRALCALADRFAEPAPRRRRAVVGRRR